VCAPQPEGEALQVAHVLARVVVVELAAAADGLPRDREGAGSAEGPEGIDGGEGGDDAGGVCRAGNGRGGSEARDDTGEGLDEVLDGVGTGEIGCDGNEGDVAEAR